MMMITYLYTGQEDAEKVENKLLRCDYFHLHGAKSFLFACRHSSKKNVTDDDDDNAVVTCEIKLSFVEVRLK